jgi:hypothetical protein
MSIEEETAFLAQSAERAEAGSILVAAEVCFALEHELSRVVAAWPVKPTCNDTGTWDQ